MEHTIRYDNNIDCKVNGTPCTLTLTIPSTMKGPVYFYYKLENFYQNHRRYVKSRNDDQLAGKVLTKFSQLGIS